MGILLVVIFGWADHPVLVAAYLLEAMDCAQLPLEPSFELRGIGGAERNLIGARLAHHWTVAGLGVSQCEYVLLYKCHKRCAIPPSCGFAIGPN